MCRSEKKSEIDESRGSSSGRGASLDDGRAGGRRIEGDGGGRGRAERQRGRGKRKRARRDETRTRRVARPGNLREPSETRRRVGVIFIPRLIAASPAASAGIFYSSSLAFFSDIQADPNGLSLLLTTAISISRPDLESVKPQAAARAAIPQPLGAALSSVRLCVLFPRPASHLTSYWESRRPAVSPDRS